MESIREAGRATQGVKLIRIDEDDKIAGITKLDKFEEDEEEVITALENPELPAEETAAEDTENQAPENDIEDTENSEDNS